MSAKKKTSPDSIDREIKDRIRGGFEASKALQISAGEKAFTLPCITNGASLF